MTSAMSAGLYGSQLVDSSFSPTIDPSNQATKYVDLPFVPKRKIKFVVSEKPSF